MSRHVDVSRSRVLRSRFLVWMTFVAALTGSAWGCGGGSNGGSYLLEDSGTDEDSGHPTPTPDAGHDVATTPDTSTPDTGSDTSTGSDTGADTNVPDANDAGVSSLTIANASVTEGNSGTKALTFTVTLTPAATQAVTVDYATSDGTATTSNTAPGGADYGAAAGTLAFAPGDTTKTITVNVNGDVTSEANETLSVTLSAPTNATIGTAVATGTIEDDDALPTISIANAIVTEGNSGTTPADFVLTLSAPSGQTVTVHAKTNDGSGIGPATVVDNDYVPIVDQLVAFSPGETTKTVTVTVNGDTTTELNETFTVDLSNPANATIATPSADGTIQNDDGAVQPSLSIADATITEGNAGTKLLNFAVTLSPSSAQTVTVDFATADGTATAIGAAAAGGLDYAAASGALSFAPGVTTQNVTVTINGDLLNEDDETFTVNLSNATNAIIGTAQATGTIQNDDAVPTISIAGASTVEGQAGTKALTFQLTLSGASGKTVSVSYATADDTATAGGSLATGGQDYASASGTINFLPGATSQTVSVIVSGDALNEADETFNVVLSAPVNATILGNGTGIGTITNDDPLPLVVIEDVSVLEGDSGTTAMMFNVSLVNAGGTPAPSGRSVSVAYATANGTATAPSDYTATSGTLNFAAGQTTQVVTVQVAGDTTLEPNETLAVNLSAPVNATISDSSAQGIITNDDGALPFVNVSDPTVVEGNAGTTQLIFTVTLSATSATDVTVDYATADGTAVTSGNSATGGDDYVSTSNTLTFAPGETSKQVSVTVNGDTANEADETVELHLSNVSLNATLQDGTGSGTITNDDALPTVSVADVSVTEGQNGNTTATFNVTLSAQSGQTVVVAYATADGTAQTSGLLAAGGSDYVGTSGTLSFAPGETTKQINVTVHGDTSFEPTETFTVNLSAPVHAALGTATGTGTITNDDTQPTISINDVSLAEGTPSIGSSLTTPFVFTVTLSNPSSQTVTVQFATANGTTVTTGLNADYTPASGTLSFAPGTTTATITVSVNKDVKNENNETFFVNLTNPSNATITDAQGLGTIQDDD